MKGDKLVHRWWLGPYKIMESIGKGRYVLKNTASGRTLKKHSIDAGEYTHAFKCYNVITNFPAGILNF